jgi:hypothetical protein
MFLRLNPKDKELETMEFGCMEYRYLQNICRLPNS